MNKDPLPNEPVVLIVDDDDVVRSSLDSLLRSVGLQAHLFGSTSEFLRKPIPDAPCCLVLDVRLPGISGLDFQIELEKAGIRIPIIFITGYGDIPMTVKAMKAGAAEFLAKPFRDREFLDAVHAAIQKDSRERATNKWVEKIKKDFRTLTPREKEVIALVTSGLMNKQIAAKLGVTEITVKVHRGNVMRKMSAKSLAELVRMSDALELKHETPQRSS
ncbi:MAG: response regulator transcription factor [Rhizobiales bacterium]|jgi:FixJ family two-component response regulator|nr:response regulator transcription factor [Hyphomicrobiales bacterium]